MAPKTKPKPKPKPKAKPKAAKHPSQRRSGRAQQGKASAAKAPQAARQPTSKRIGVQKKIKQTSSGRAQRSKRAARPAASATSSRHRISQPQQTNSQATAWLDKQNLVFFPKSKASGEWVTTYVGRSKAGNGRLVSTSKRFHLEGLVREMEVLKTLSNASTCKHVILPESWEAFGSAVVDIFQTAEPPIATARSLLESCSLSTGLATAAALHMAKALQHLHSHFILHADLQPSAVQLHSKGHELIFKLADFYGACLLPPENTAAAELHGRASPNSPPADTQTATATETDLAPKAAASTAEPAQSTPMPLLYQRGKHVAPEMWPESVGKGRVYNAPADVWAYGWLSRS